MNTLNNILDLTGGEKFYRFGNADGKHWIMPARGMRTAMNLYQPSGNKGKAVKALLPYLHTLAPVRKAIKAECLKCRLNKELNNLLCNLFGVQRIEFALFEGTPCVHQKITMQLSCGKRILGYCKLSDSNDIKNLFEKENGILQRLWKCNVAGIPKPIFCGTLTNGIHLFVQSTEKSTSSKCTHEWSSLHDGFLAQLQEKTRCSMLFEESDYFKSIASLEEHMDWLPDNVERDCIANAITKMKREHCGHEMELCAFHGDFTPWNMFIEHGKLFVFDFEYAAMSYPPGLDRYHHFTQTAVFERHWNADDILAYAKSDEGKWIDRKLYAMYLLDVISRFTMREGGKVTGKAAEPFLLWSEVLKRILTI